MPVAKNHVPLSRVVLVRMTNEDFDRVKKEAKRRKMGVGTLIRSIFFSCFDKEVS